MASVTKDGRVVLYYVGGNPVYSDSAEGGQKTNDTDKLVSQLLSQKKKNRDKDKNKDDRGKDKGKDKPGKDDKDENTRYAVKKIVRNSQGTLSVIYVDPKTGQRVFNLKNVEIISSASTLDDIYNPNGKPAETPKPSKDDDKVKETEKDDNIILRGEDPWVSSVQGGGTDTGESPGKDGRKSGPTSAGASVGTDSNTNEQGDQDFSYASTKAIKERSEQNKVATNRIDSEDTSVSSNEDSSYQSPDITSGFTAPKDQAYAAPTSLDSYDYSTGNVKAPYEGQDLSQTTVYGDVKEYTPAQITDVAKTLAGEMDTRYSDPNSEEGEQEATGIVSTMQNRDDVSDGDISAAIHAPNQYSTWNNEKVAKVAEDNYDKNPAQWEGLAARILSDPSKRMPYTNYYNPSIVNPSWAENLENTKQLGPHMFGEDPSINVTKNNLTAEQQDQVATNNINNSFQNSFAAPAGQDISQTAPDVGVQRDMATGMQAQRDYTGPSDSNIGQIGTDIGGFTDGYAAQKDYNGPSVTGPSIDTSGFDAGRFGPEPGDTSNFDAGRFGPEPGDTSDFDAGRFGDPGADTSNTDADPSNNFDSSRFGDPDTSSFDSSRLGPSISPSSTGVYGDPTGGFGSYVNTDENASANISGFTADNVSKQINDQTANTTSTPGTGVDSNTISGTAPDVSTSVSSMSDTTSNTEASNATASADASTGSWSGSSVGDSDVSAGPTSTGFSSSPDDATDTGGTTDSTDSTGSTTGGGLFGGFFGGDTDTDAGTDSGTSTSGTSGSGSVGDADGGTDGYD